MTVTSGSNLGPFRILAPLGRGGMASVYKAYEPGLDRYVAVKILPSESLHDPTFAERFRREARVVAKLEHPHIIPIYAYGIDEGVPWMSMRLISGGSLASFLKSGGRLSPARLLAVLQGMAHALDYAHAAGVVHRDVKPQNVLVDDREHVYLADFGVAKMVEGEPGLTQAGMISGTPQYMAPEQALGGALDHRADIYSLGVVAYECLTGRVPFTADTPLAVLMKHVREPIPLPPVEEVPDPLMRVVLKALAKAPPERWPTAGAFVDALRRLGEMPTEQMQAIQGAPTLVTPRPTPGGAAAPPTAASPATLRSPVSTRWLLPSLAVLLAVALPMAWWVFRTGRTAPARVALEPADRTAESKPQPTPIAPAARPSLPPLSSTTLVSPAPVPTPAPLPKPTTRLTVTPLPPPVTVRPATRTPTPAEGPPPPPAVSPISSPTPASGRESSLGIRAGVPFSLNSKITLGNPAQGPVSLQSARFKFDPRKAELQAEVEGYCQEGKDQAVEVQIEMLDAAGETLGRLSGKGTIEENETGAVKAKQRLTDALVARITQFRLTFQAKPD